MSFPDLVPADYYTDIREAEDDHWWHRGMREIGASLLGDRLDRADALLDVGCGTGGFLRWANERGSPGQLVGVDISPEAIELARRRLPEAQLQVAPIWAMPLESHGFDLVVINDVLQHIPTARISESLAEVRRVMREVGELLIRTNGARRCRDDGDWRLYDADALRSELERAGFRVQRVTHANLIGSLWAQTRGGAPRAPNPGRHGIPARASGRGDAVKYRLLRAEAAYLRRSQLPIPYGHTLFALAAPASRQPGPEPER
jgi:ubiquinone/menaquinone biosynthesis C-methylase UbiE